MNDNINPELKERFDRTLREDIYQIPKGMHVSFYQSTGALPDFEPIIAAMNSAYQMDRDAWVSVEMALPDNEDTVLSCSDIRI